MKPLPTTAAAWLDEVRHAFAEANGTPPAVDVLRDRPDPESFFTIVTALCAKYRGFPAFGQRFDRARQMALVSYVASSEKQEEIFKVPEVAFAFCYVTSQLGYDLISRNEAKRLMDYFMEHPDRLLAPADPHPAPRKRAPAKDDLKLEELLRLITAFCKAHLNQEYEDLCARLARKAGRKRTPPFATGKIEGWAAGVVHAICTTNFAFDKSQTPHVTSPCIAEHFGVSLNTASQKSKILRDMFRIRHWDSEFSTEEMEKQNPAHMLRIW